MLLPLLIVPLSLAQEPVYPNMPEGTPPLAELEGAEAADAASMKAYEELVPGTEIRFGLAPLAAGAFQMGSPEDEDDRGDDEGPLREIQLDAFWIGTHEVRWQDYHVFMFRLDRQLRAAGEAQPVEQDAWADAVSRPTPPYVPMDFEMGVKDYPAICMTHLAAKQYTKWLSMKTGRFYRLPTEAEWEYACRAGTDSAYSFGDDPDDLEDYAWYFDNADDQYQKVGTKKPNPWGLYDMHGNVAEWVLDSLSPYEADSTANPIAWPTKEYGRVVRGGSWDDDPDRLRSAARRGSRKGWKVQDPQLPKSIWYHTDARFVGFRVVRPLNPPPMEERARYWEPDVTDIAEIMEKQRSGAR